MEYKLQYPIERDEGGERDTLAIKDRVKGADMLVLDEHGGEVDTALRIIAKMCKISRAEAERLDAADIGVLSEMIAKKLGRSLDGETKPRS